AAGPRLSNRLLLGNGPQERFEPLDVARCARERVAGAGKHGPLRVEVPLEHVADGVEGRVMAAGDDQLRERRLRQLGERDLRLPRRAFDHRRAGALPPSSGASSSACSSKSMRSRSGPGGYPPRLGIASSNRSRSGSTGCQATVPFATLPWTKTTRTARSYRVQSPAKTRQRSRFC